ncbi:hypothetical protein HDU91_004214 [Kappamyces sp. JEL0680]|nr:hypothetical protein HDU91_004214 [Kappamyces sp. JEL0680]
MTPLQDLAVIVDSGLTRPQLDELIRENKVKGFPVTDIAGKSLGYISRSDLFAAVQDIPFATPIRIMESDIDFVASRSVSLSAWLDRSPMMVHPHFRLEIVAELFKKMGLRFVLVTRNGVLLGMITKKDLIRGGI